MKKRTLYILTFGIAYLIAKRKAKKIAATNNTELRTSSNIDINLDQLIEKLGSKANIVKIESRINSLTIELKDISKINIDEFNVFNPKGLYISGNKLILLLGDNSKAIHKELELILNK